MAREIRLSDGRTALVDDDATDEEINKKLASRGLSRQEAAAPAAPAAAQAAPAAGPAAQGPVSPLPGGAPTAYLASTANSLLFGVPEMIARGMGAGPTIEATRAASPTASTAGDITGMISPATLGARVIGGGLIKGGSRLMGGSRAPEAVAAGESAVLRTVERNKQLHANATTRLDETEAFYRANPDLPDAKRMFDNARKEFNDITAELDKVEKLAARERGSNLLSTTGRTAARTTGGIMGLQTGAGMLGGARSDNFGPGFQQGATTAGQAVQQYNPLSMVPGVPQVTQGVTSVVPGVAGYGSMLADQASRYININDEIRREAARKALQGPQ